MKKERKQRKNDREKNRGYGIFMLAVLENSHTFFAMYN